MTAPRLARATLTPLDNRGRAKNDQTFTLDFNPAKLDFKVSHEVKKSGKRARQKIQYTGDSTATLTFEAVFDNTRPRGLETPAGTPEDDQNRPELLDIRARTRKFVELLDHHRWTRQRRNEDGSRRTVNMAGHFPYLFRFSWGSIHFEGVVKTYAETLEYFSPDGVPLRSKVNVTLEQVTRKLRIEPGDQRLSSQSGGGGGGGGGTGGPTDTEPGGGAEDGVRPDAALSDAGATLEQANAIAGANGLDSLFDLGAQGGLSLGLDLDLDVSASVGLDLGLDATLGVGIGARLDLDLDVDADLRVSAGLDLPTDPATRIAVFGAGATKEGVVAQPRGPARAPRPRGNPWSDDGPAPGTRESDLAAAVNARPARGTLAADPPLRSHFKPGQPAAVPAADLPLRGSAPRAPQLGGELPRALRRRPEGLGTSAHGRPKWETLPPDDQGDPRW